ncbi:MAG: DUF1223 domain-containing protein [Pseudomonadota bacterium]
MIRSALRHMSLALTLVAAPLLPASAGDNPVVLELFTSQGCSSCPPADKLLHQLAAREDVIALALHVDYWDYIGWKDEFASPDYSDRQRVYAAVAGRRTIYTPQIIVNGTTSIVGARAMELSDAIQAHKAKAAQISITLERNGDQVGISATNAADVGPMIVHVLQYQPERDAKILRGENAGRHLAYANVVQGWQVLGTWLGEEPLSANTTVDGDWPVVVLLQEAPQGAILAAARVK